MTQPATDPQPPLCPDCGQPGSEALAGAPHGWECRNEACPEFGQALQEHEPPPRDEPGPGRPL
ncbi:MAG TPA: hypothetical protein VN213_04890 [Solirubrobacteraceae bacterium]|nr:hypothetical protein [Solirubrobacteraceae bacterium]